MNIYYAELLITTSRGFEHGLWLGVCVFASHWRLFRRHYTVRTQKANWCIAINICSDCKFNYIIIVTVYMMCIAKIGIHSRNQHSQTDITTISFPWYCLIYKNKQNISKQINSKHTNNLIFFKCINRFKYGIYKYGKNNNTTIENDCIDTHYILILFYWNLYEDKTRKWLEIRIYRCWICCFIVMYAEVHVVLARHYDHNYMKVILPVPVINYNFEQYFIYLNTVHQTNTMYDNDTY